MTATRTAWFANCANPEEIKKHFRTLAMQHHPDRGGDTETMRLIIEAYHAALKAKDGWTAPYADNPKRTYRYRYDANIEQNLLDKINALLALRMAGVEIWLIGRWVWANGDTKPHREALKALGFTWHHTRKAWYLAGVPSGYNSNADFDALAAKYGMKEWKIHEDPDPSPARHSIA
jgi:hypothetical protein